jgi:nucleoside-diphosphate-sugar epimerase
MKVHVTGATGFIGRVLSATLPAAGHESVSDVAKANAVVHLAGLAHRRASRDELRAVNIALAERTARSAADHGAHFVFLSSVKVHGEQSQAPFVESSPISPEDDYADSKARAEDLLRSVPRLSLTVLRPPLVYGPGVKANFLALVRAIERGWPLPLASIENRRSLIYVGNLVDAIVRCLDAPGTFLVSDGAPVSTAQLCCEIGDVLGRRARLFAFPTILLPRKLARSLELDDLAIRRKLDWRPPFSRRAGLEALAHWYARESGTA